MNRDGAVLAELRRRRDNTSRIRQQEIGRDEDLPTRPKDGIRQDLTVLQEDKLRIDVHAPAATRAINHRRTDLAVSQLHRAVGVRCDLDRPSA